MRSSGSIELGSTMEKKTLRVTTKKKRKCKGNRNKKWFHIATHHRLQTEKSEPVIVNNVKNNCQCTLLFN